MAERGSALLEALVVTAIVGLIWASAMQALASLPAQAARWEEAAAVRQRARVIESRIGRLVARAAPIALEVDGVVVRLPSLWPRRLGLLRAGPQDEVSDSAMTLLSRVDGHRALTLITPLSGSAADVSVIAQRGCGSEADCGLRTGDFVLVAERGGACGLYRVVSVGALMRLETLMTPGAPIFPIGSVIIPIAIDAFSFDADDQALRRYDGYRSDNVMVDGLRSIAITWRGAPALGDGPFVGTGPLAFDADQLLLRDVAMTVELVESALSTSTVTASFAWRTGGWR